MLANGLLMMHDNIQILSIVADGRSGSLFVQSLFDNHPEVIVFPGVVIHEIDIFWGKTHNYSSKEIIDCFIKEHPVIFNTSLDTTICGLSLLGENKNEYLVIDEVVFKNYFISYYDKTNKEFKDFIISIHLAYGFCTNKSLSKVKLIVHALHLPDRKKMLFYKTHLPEGKYLITTRAPITLWNSTLKVRRRIIDDVSFYIFRHNHFHISKLVTNTEIDLLYYHQYMQVISIGNIRVVKIEEINDNINNFIRKLTLWLNIQPNKELFESTFGGKKWWGDKIMQKNNNDELDFINPFFLKDKLVIEYLLYSRINKYSYPFETQFRKSFIHHILILILIFLPSKWEYSIINQYLFPISVSKVIFQKIKPYNTLLRKIKYSILYIVLFYSSFFFFVGNYFQRIYYFYIYYILVNFKKDKIFTKL